MTEARARWLDQIRARLVEVARWCSDQPAWFTTRPVCSHSEVEAFEAEHGIRLPEGYRLFLTEIGNGGAGLAWHGDCDCGRLSGLSELSTTRAALPFPIDDDEWFDDGEDALRHDDGAVLIGHSVDHCSYYLVVTGPRAGEVWLDATGYDGPFERIAGDFLEHSARLLGELVDSHCWRDAAENRALAAALGPRERLEFYTEPRNVNGLLAGGRVAEELEEIIAALPARTRHHGWSKAVSICCAIIERRLREQERAGVTEPLDPHECRLVASLWIALRAREAKHPDLRLMPKHGWLAPWTAYPAVYLGLGGLWGEMLAEARRMIAAGGGDTHVTHARIALASLGEDPATGPAYSAEPEHEAWEEPFVQELVRRLDPRARQRLEACLPEAVRRIVTAERG